MSGFRIKRFFKKLGRCILWLCIFIVGFAIFEYSFMPILIFGRLFFHLSKEEKIDRKAGYERWRARALDNHWLNFGGTVEDLAEPYQKLKDTGERILAEHTQMFSDEEVLIEKSVYAKWLVDAKSFLEDVKTFRKKRFGCAQVYRDLLPMMERCEGDLKTFSNCVSAHNKIIWDTRIDMAYKLIGEVEGHTLDRQQMKCIVKEARSHLVIAGAGSGKTTTIVARVKYLLQTGTCKPEDILVLSFTNASATEMRERIQAETGCPIAAMTFHKLGLSVLNKVTEKVPKISKLLLRDFILDTLEEELNDPVYAEKVSRYLLFGRVNEKNEFDFSDNQSYQEWLELNPPTSLRGEKLKSYGEMHIANFLLQNGISYKYEFPYEIDTSSEKYGAYYPDFYLPDANVYIEFFGVDRNNRVPSYFRGRDGRSASAVYYESMEWKRALHKAQGTRLIELFAYEHLEGTLLARLEEHLRANGVKLNPKDPVALWNEVNQTEQEKRNQFDGLSELFETLICLIKSNDYDFSTVRELCVKGRGVSALNNRLLLDILEPIYCAYCNELKISGTIDFNDMINQATSCVQQGKFKNPFRYVIVDEYQDISKARFRLLEALRNSYSFDLFCVGDDWQSIYRFAGSDISYILNFEKYWGPCEISRIETTYRFSQKLIEISGNFVMKNPAQIKKSIKGKRDPDNVFPFSVIKGYTEEAAVKFLEETLKELPKYSSVYFIGRYSFDAKILRDSGLFRFQYDNVQGVTRVLSDKYPHLTMSFLTAHKSKGLQADYVFILNNKNSRLGFPSRIQDADIITKLLDSEECFPFAEERRLFYVALTRAKKKVFLLAVDGKESVFCKELEKTYTENLRVKRLSCPICGAKLYKRKGIYGEFYGCANYNVTGCTYTRTIK